MIHDVILQQWFYRVNHCVPWWCHWVFQIRNLQNCRRMNHDLIQRYAELQRFHHISSIGRTCWNQVDYTCLSADFASTQTGLLAVGSVGSVGSGEDGMIHFYKWMPYFWEQNTKSRMVCQLIRMIFSMFGWEKTKAHWFKVPFFSPLKNMVHRTRIRVSRPWAAPMVACGSWVGGPTILAGQVGHVATNEVAIPKTSKPFKATSSWGFIIIIHDYPMLYHPFVVRLGVVYYWV